MTKLLVIEDDKNLKPVLIVVVDKFDDKQLKYT